MTQVSVRGLPTTENEGRKEQAAPLCLRLRRLPLLPFPPIPLNFPRERSWAEVWQECRSLNSKMRNLVLAAVAQPIEH